MSRIGNKPVVIPQGVKVQVVDRGVSAEGPKGKLVQPLPPGLSAKIEDSRVIISRAGEDRKVRALHGLARSLVQNMVAGVKEPFERKLEIVGIGYRAQVQRSEEHTSELQSLTNLVCRLLLEKKKKRQAPR